MMVSQCPNLEQSWNDNYEIYRKMYVYREACFSDRIFANGLNMGLSLSLSGNSCLWSWNIFSGKENVLGAVVYKEKNHIDSFLGHVKTTISIDFLEKDATVNSTFFCQLRRLNSLYLMNDPCCVTNSLIVILIFISFTNIFKFSLDYLLN